METTQHLVRDCVQIRRLTRGGGGVGGGGELYSTPAGERRPEREGEGGGRRGVGKIECTTRIDNFLGSTWISGEGGRIKMEEAKGG